MNISFMMVRKKQCSIFTYASLDFICASCEYIEGITLRQLIGDINEIPEAIISAIAQRVLYLAPNILTCHLLGSRSTLLLGQ